jgi:KilA-N domain
MANSTNNFDGRAKHLLRVLELCGGCVPLHRLQFEFSNSVIQTLLDHDMKILISLLVIDIQGYGSEQSTWIHPEIAIDLARWVSVEFRIWANNKLLVTKTKQLAYRIRKLDPEVDLNRPKSPLNMNHHPKLPTVSPT